MVESARRIVTISGQSGEGIVSDGLVCATEFGEGLGVVELWRADGSGAPVTLDQPWSLMPPSGGHVLRISEFPPAGGGDLPWMHRTATVDYAVVLEGELTLVMGGGEEAILRPGDIVVQQGADHGWINRSAAICRIAVVMIDTPAARP